MKTFGFQFNNSAESLTCVKAVNSIGESLTVDFNKMVICTVVISVQIHHSYLDPAVSPRHRLGLSPLIITKPTAVA